MITKEFEKAYTFENAQTMIAVFVELKKMGEVDAYSCHSTIDHKRVLGLRLPNGEWGYLECPHGFRNAGEFKMQNKA